MQPRSLETKDNDNNQALNSDDNVNGEEGELSQEDKTDNNNDTDYFEDEKLDHMDDEDDDYDDEILYGKFSNSFLICKFD